MRVLLLTLLACMPHLLNAQVKGSEEHRMLIKQHVYQDYKQMYRQPSGGSLVYPYLTPGSKQYDKVHCARFLPTKAATMTRGRRLALKGAVCSTT